MTRKFTSRRFVFFIALASFLMNYQGFADIKVDANLASPTIPTGGYTMLTITVQGTSRCNVELPVVKGLVLRDSGTSQNTSIINGKLSRSSTVRIAIIGETAGSYKIPPLTVTAENETFQTPEYDVTVTDQPNGSTTSPGGKNSKNNSALHKEDIERIAKIKLVCAEAQIYEGQKIPVAIELWINTAHQFENLSAPILSNDNILATNLSQEYTENIRIENNERYKVFRWDTSITGLKAGDIKLSSHTEVTLLARAKRQRSAFDSFFDSDFFGSSYRRIPLGITSNELPLTIKRVPEPRPEGFTGAVGAFSISAEASPTEITEGDPITFDFMITGKGNLDRVFHDGLRDDEAFKTYSPESALTDSNSNDGTGTKSFKQAIIPQNSDLTEIPPITFVYFDTDTESYQTIESAPIAITVMPSSTPEEGSFSSGETGNSNTRDQGIQSINSDGWIALQLDLDKTSRSTTPWILDHTKVAIAGASLVIFTIILSLAPALVSRRNSDRSNRIKRLKKELKNNFNCIEDALKTNNTTEFVKHSANYSKTLLGSSWGVAAESITVLDAKRRLDGKYPQIILVLELDDTIQYAGEGLMDTDIKATFQAITPEWNKILQSIAF